MSLYPPGGYTALNGYYTIKPREDITPIEQTMIDRLQNGYYIVMKSMPEDELLMIGGPYPSEAHMVDELDLIARYTDETIVTVDGNWYGPQEETNQEAT